MNEQAWWGLTDAERAYLEQCVTAIIHWFAVHPEKSIELFREACARHSDIPLVQAISWRLMEELSYV